MQRRSANRFTIFAKNISPPWHYSPTGNGFTLLFRVLICSKNRLISSYYLATVSTDIAILAANSASRPPFADGWVAAAAMLSHYPSSESRSWFVSWGFPSVFFFLVFFRVPIQTDQSLQRIFFCLSCSFCSSLSNVRRPEGGFLFHPGLFVFWEFRPLPCFCLILTGLE